MTKAAVSKKDTAAKKKRWSNKSLAARLLVSKIQEGEIKLAEEPKDVYDCYDQFSTADYSLERFQNAFYREKIKQGGEVKEKVKYNDDDDDSGKSIFRIFDHLLYFSHFPFSVSSRGQVVDGGKGEKYIKWCPIHGI